jgi:hypothetical protein
VYQEQLISKSAGDALSKKKGSEQWIFKRLAYKLIPSLHITPFL